MASGTPNQDRNAGNRGDVWKHRTLLAIADRLLKDLDSNKTFRYFESHAGKGLYRLEASKGAREGILQALNSLPASDAYIEAEAASVKRGEYLGSWRLVSDLLDTRGRAGRFQLCEMDAAVLEVARHQAAPRHEFDFHRGDGFAAARTEDADLYFIDPFDSWPQSMELARDLRDKNFLIWYGIVANTKPNELVQSSGLTGFEALWSPIHTNHSPTQRGCGLLFSESLQRVLPEIVGDFLEASMRLGWQLHFRVPREIPQS